MPIYRTALQDATVVVPFMVDGEYVTPEIGSVSYTVYDNSGVAVPALTNLAVVTDANTNTILITIPAANNTLDGLVTSVRTVIVSYLFGVHPIQHRISYTLHSFVNLSVTPEDCRAAVGLGVDELPDGDLDLISAYLRIKSSYSTFDDKLAAGGVVSLDANDAVRFRACLDAMPALRRRVAKRRTVDGVTVEKADTDLDRMEADLRARLASALTSAMGSVTVTPALLVVGTRTDPLTGA